MAHTQCHSHSRVRGMGDVSSLLVILFTVDTTVIISQAKLKL